MNVVLLVRDICLELSKWINVCSSTANILLTLTIINTNPHLISFINIVIQIFSYRINNIINDRWRFFDLVERCLERVSVYLSVCLCVRIVYEIADCLSVFIDHCFEIMWTIKWIANSCLYEMSWIKENKTKRKPKVVNHW